MRYGVALSIAVLGTVLGNGALAAVRITSQAVMADGKTSQHIIYLTPDRAKFDLDRIAVIVRADTGKMVTLMKDKREYMDIDPKQMSADIAAVQAQLQQRLQSLPEAQRKQIEAMMGQHGMPGAQGKQHAVETTYEKTGQTRTVGSWSCQVFHQKKDGNLIADLCMAPVAAVGLTRDDLAAFRALGETVRKSLPDEIRRNAPMMDFDAQTRQIGFEGFPVEAAIYVSGKVRTTTTVKSVDHAPLPPDIFEVPAGYARKQIPDFAIGDVGGR